MSRRMKKTLSLVLVLIMCISLCSMGASAAGTTKYLNAEEAAVALRGMMKERQTEVSINYATDYPVSYSRVMEILGSPTEIAKVTAELITKVTAEFIDIFAEAFEHTGDPCEGDYLFYQYLGFVPHFDSFDFTQLLNGKIGMKANFTLSYRTTAEQEQQVNAKVADVLASLNLDGKSDFEKVKAIYDWMGDNIVYDWAGLASYATKPIASTAYACLFDGTAVCQGYSVLFYRLCLEEGIDARVVQDVTGGGAPHLWNIVQMDDGMYYYIDTTLGAGVEQVFDLDPYAFFLKGSTYWSKLPGYTLGDQYTNATLYPGFAAQFPMSAADYEYTLPENPDTPDTPDAPDTPDTPDVPDEPTGCDCASHCRHVAAVAAGCEAAGNIEYWYCTECGTCYSDAACTTAIAPESVVTAAIGHNLKHVSAKSATALTKGNTEYWQCTNCGTCFSDPDGVNVIAQSSTVIPATGFTSIITGIVNTITNIISSIFRWK